MHRAYILKKLVLLGMIALNKGGMTIWIYSVSDNIDISVSESKIMQL